MSSNVCCKIDAGDCRRNADGNYISVRKCVLKTSDGDVECECNCGPDCKNCICDCQCSTDTVQKVHTE
ncbi:unnamed protein product, partial [Tenebrio molitor]